MFYFLLLFILPPIVFLLYAQSKAASTYENYLGIENSQQMTGVQVAKVLLQAHGLRHVTIGKTCGQLTDHYDSRKKVIRLSKDVYETYSTASLGIVAHEVGHAIQDQANYVPLRMREVLLPAANVSCRLGWLFVVLGMVLYISVGSFGYKLALVGITLFAGAMLLAAVTLVVECDANRRGRQMLTSCGFVSQYDYDAASAVLSATALTYVATLLQPAAVLLQFFVRILCAKR